MTATLHPTDELPKIDISRSYKDVKSPRFVTADLCWLYGLWIARGGYGTSGIYFSIPRFNAAVANRAMQIGIAKFNVHPKYSTHSKARSRIMFDSIAIKQWWRLVDLDGNVETAHGILEAGSWKKGNHLVVTCRKDKADLLERHLSTLGAEIKRFERESKNSVDLYLQNYLQIKQTTQDDQPHTIQHM